MAMRNICEGDVCAIGGPKEVTIILPVTLTHLPDKITVEGITLLRRTKFHVSLVCVGQIIEKFHVELPDFIAAVTTDFCTYTKERPIQFKGFRDEFRFVTKDEKRSLIAMCDIENLEGFFDLLNKKYSLHISYPPTHVTLYTLQTDMGIFVTDADELVGLTKRVPAPFSLNELK